MKDHQDSGSPPKERHPAFSLPVGTVQCCEVDAVLCTKCVSNDRGVEGYGSHEHKGVLSKVGEGLAPLLNAA